MKKTLITLLAVAGLALGSGAAIAATNYTITDLGTLITGGMSYATGINNNGQVVGWSAEFDTTTGTTAFVWDSANKMQSLGTSGAATAINGAGQVVGYSKAADGSYQAFLYSGGMLQPLGSSYGMNSSAYAINSSGLIGGTIQTNVKDAQNKYTNYLAATWSGSTATALSALQTIPYDAWGGPVSQVYSINNSGVKVGKSSVGAPFGDNEGDPASHATVWTASGHIIDLGTIGSCSTVSGICTSAAFGINNAGQVVGVSGDETNTNLRPFLFSNWEMKDLGTLAGTTSGYAYAINNNGQAVGFSSDYVAQAANPAIGTTEGSLTKATLWNIDANGNATAMDLNSLIAGSGWTLWGATGINDKGQIVGYGIQGEGPEATFHAFMLSPEAAPVPLPPAVFMFVPGLAALGMLRRRFIRA